MITKDKKQQTVAELVEKLQGAKGVYFVDFAKITVAQMIGIRRQMKDAGILVKVAKNTLLLRAWKEVSGSEFDEKMLFGQTAMIISYDDAIAPAKIIKTFYEKEDKLRLKLAVIEGQVFDGKDLKTIASLPSRADLVAGILGSLQSPISGIVGSINAVMRDLASVIEEAAKKKAA